MRPSYARTIPSAWQRTARMFVALGHPHRQRIVLMFEPAERLNVGQIVAASTLSRSAVAHHLKVLREAGVVRAEKVGKEMWYRTDPQAVRIALTVVLKYLAQLEFHQ
jgi:ArsR family transcriptional regulator